MNYQENNWFSSVLVEGGMFSRDFLHGLSTSDARIPGINSDSYRLDPKQRLSEAVSKSWNTLSVAWESVRAESTGPKSARRPMIDWLLLLFKELGFHDIVSHKSVTEVGGKRYFISHSCRSSPIHLLSDDTDLDQRESGKRGAAQGSPHSIVQSFLNRSDDHLWGFVSNGSALRVLRDRQSFSRESYVEFDLKSIMEGRKFDAFLIMYLLCHASRIDGPEPSDCWLERWLHLSREDGVSALDKLRSGVEAAVETFGRGFLTHPDNDALRERIRSGIMTEQELYRQLLRLIYRLIFIFVAEGRDVLLDPKASQEAKDRYWQFYSTGQLRTKLTDVGGNTHEDLWEWLRLLMGSLDNGCPELALPALGGRLWSEQACPDLMNAQCSNKHLTGAVRSLTLVRESHNNQLANVNWRFIGSDELGSVYEGLLELHPLVQSDPWDFRLSRYEGHERRTTGSYYTPTDLVDSLLDTALDPVLEKAMASKQAADEVLRIKVCDPACGSGHFLIAAARRMANCLASARVPVGDPSPEDRRHAMREVIARCIYGVDMNPMAVELCKVGLWLEAIEPGRPLSFLDSHIRCGNAILGATPGGMANGISDAAFKPIEGDNKDIAKRLRRRNTGDRKGKPTFFAKMLKEVVDDDALLGTLKELEGTEDNSIAELREKERLWVTFSESKAYRTAWLRADIWCAAHMWPKQTDNQDTAAVTHDLWQHLVSDISVLPEVSLRIVRELSTKHNFFHWHLAFPQVFGDHHIEADGEAPAKDSKAGFDVILGNPPWEKNSIKEKEWFPSRFPALREASTVKERKRMIKQVETTDPELWKQWQSARRERAEVSHFVKVTGSYELSAVGDINLYALFTELSMSLAGDVGRVGIIVPTTIVTSTVYREWFQHVFGNNVLEKLYSFINHERSFFPAVDSRMTFTLMTLNLSGKAERPEMLFGLQQVRETHNPDRTFTLSMEDIELINPNTKTCPVFEQPKDIELSKRVYQTVPILKNRNQGKVQSSEGWNMSIHSMLHKTQDAELFYTAKMLEQADARRVGNIFQGEQGGETYYPVYDGKMVGMWDHRDATIEFKEGNRFRKEQPKKNAVSQKMSHCFLNEPYQWVHENTIRTLLPKGYSHKWFFTLKAVSSASNARMLIGCVVPYAALSNSLHIVNVNEENIDVAPCLYASLNSFVVDYFCRMKTTGSGLPMYVIEQCPILSPSTFREAVPWKGNQSISMWIEERVTDLTYTCQELDIFAKDFGRESEPVTWSEQDRFDQMCELDAGMFILYGMRTVDVEYIMDTFSVIRGYDETAHGCFRTKARILEIFEEMSAAVK